jgi:Holliday junction resolvase
MKNWQIFEKNCLEYLNQTNLDVIRKYTSKGSSDSTISDIQVMENNVLSYYIEAKMPKSQCGQFVLLKNDDNEFYFSERNKIVINEFSKQIIEYINANKLNEIEKKNIPLVLSQDLIVDYILTHYKEKEVKYIITKKKDDYQLIPLNKNDLLNAFEFSGTLRMKKSGSRSLTKAFEDKLFHYIEKEFISKEIIDNKTMYLLNKEGDFIIHIDGYDLFFKQQENKMYVVRILSNTNNYCVIFSLNLK